MRITVSHTIQPVVQTPTGFTVTVERRIRASSDEEPAAIGPVYTRPPRRSRRGLGLRPPGVRGAHTRGARVAAMDDGRDQWRERAGWAESELEAAIVDRDTWRERAKRAESDLGVATAERDRLRERAEELEADLRTTETDRDCWQDYAEVAVNDARAERSKWRERAGRAEAALERAEATLATIRAADDLRREAIRAVAAKGNA